MYPFLPLLPLLPLLLSAPVASAACWDIYSNINTHSDAQPCNNIDGTVVPSMCCDTNRSAAYLPITPDTCLLNGLCKNVQTDTATNQQVTQYWREGCSDSGWSSQYCLKGVCTGSSVSISLHSTLSQCLPMKGKALR
jgi:hypothetical protein